MKTRGIRVPDALWEAAVAKADAEGVYVSEVIREALEVYIAAPSDVSPAGTTPPVDTD